MKQSILIKNKKAQGWGLDLIAAIVIFMSGVIVLYVYSINYVSESQNNLESMVYEGNLAAELILTDDDRGILANDQINQTKLEEFNASYSTRKANFGIKDDFYFKIEGLELFGNPVDYIGKANTTEVTDMIQITRITVYKNKITKFELYIWQE
jgi:hypothetical protein